MVMGCPLLNSSWIIRREIIKYTGAAVSKAYSSTSVRCRQGESHKKAFGSLSTDLDRVFIVRIHHLKNIHKLKKEKVKRTDKIINFLAVERDRIEKRERNSTRVSNPA